MQRHLKSHFFRIPSSALIWERDGGDWREEGHDGGKGESWGRKSPFLLSPLPNKNLKYARSMTFFGYL